MHFAKITRELESVGVNKKHKGFNYLRDGISVIIMYELSVDIKNVYEFLSQCYRVTPQSIERSIRYCIEYAWARGDIENIEKMFGFTVQCEKGKPTNREFMFMIADRIMFQNMDK